jgi:glutamine cyclotransferase
MKKYYWFLLAAPAVFFISCTNNDTSSSNSGATPEHTTPSMSFSIASTLPHDTSFFTEGLEFYNNTLLESTGLPGKSRLVQTDPATGKVLQMVHLDPKYFGEGITVLHDTIFQLTWQEHVVHVYTAKDFKKIKELPLNGEGWGLTNDGKNLIASDGSSNLYYYDPSSFKLVRTLSVTENGSMVLNINELEYVNGFIYANQWQYNYILKINPTTGEVVAKLDLTDQVNKVHATDPHAEYLNGLAYNPNTKKFYVTGKLWSELYELQFDR